jgi:hypothetical protein
MVSDYYLFKNLGNTFVSFMVIELVRVSPDFSLIKFSSKCVVLCPDLDDSAPLLPDVRLHAAGLGGAVDCVLQRNKLSFGLLNVL